MPETPSLIQHFPYVGIFALLILGGIGLPFPEDGTLLLSGILVSQELIRPVPTLIVIYGGLLLTDFFLYYMGKKYGRKVVEQRRFHKLITPEHISSMERRFKRWGPWFVFLGRHVFVLRAQLFVVAGIMRMPKMKFLLVDGISALFTIGIWGGIGYWGGSSIPHLVKGAKAAEYAGGIIMAALIAGGGLYWYFRIRNRSKHKE